MAEPGHMDLSRFDRLAAEWDSTPARVELARAVGAAIREAVPSLRTDHRCIELGAGTGLVTLCLLPFVGHVVALDSARGMLEQLHRKQQSAGLVGVEPVWWDLEEAAFPRTGFDGAFSSMTLHHCRDTERMMARLFALLRPGGWLAVADLDTEDGSFHSDPAGVFHRGFDRVRLGQMARDAGFREVATRTAHRIRRASAEGSREYTVFLLTATRGP